MKTGWVIAFSVVCTLLAAGIVYLAASPPRGEAIALLPPPTPLPLLVQVSGAVKQPGVCSLPAGSRVKDALDAAGGLAPSAEPGSLNLAAYLEDGQRIDVPFWEPTLPPAQGEDPAAGPSRMLLPTLKTQAANPEPGSSSGPININTASQAELESLPYIGPALAQRIIEYRQENGPFQTIEDLQKVKGIGPVTFARLKDLITVSE